MTQPAKVQEPSMEEILASIRRIIADDEAKPADIAIAAGVGAGIAKAAEPVRPPLTAVASVTPHPASMRSEAPAQTFDVAQSREEIITMPADSEAPPAVEPDILELTDEMAMPAAVPAFRKVEPKDDVEFAAAAQTTKRSDPSPRAAEPEMADMLSRSTASAVESAFNSLASTVLSNNARTLEDLVKEMMRPMLKNWLDDNLPGLVERIVKTEIERVSRGR